MTTTLFVEYAYVFVEGGILYIIIDVEEFGKWMFDYMFVYLMFECVFEVEFMKDFVVLFFYTGIEEG